MAKLTKNYSLEVVLPDLALQWHPTKNGILRPTDFTPGSNKKVWWICNNGHEWHAPINSRKNWAFQSSCRVPLWSLTV